MSISKMLSISSRALKLILIPMTIWGKKEELPLHEIDMIQREKERSLKTNLKMQPTTAASQRFFYTPN